MPTPHQAVTLFTRVVRKTGQRVTLVATKVSAVRKFGLGQSLSFAANKQASGGGITVQKSISIHSGLD